MSNAPYKPGDPVKVCYYSGKGTTLAPTEVVNITPRTDGRWNLVVKHPDHPGRKSENLSYTIDGRETDYVMPYNAREDRIKRAMTLGYHLALARRNNRTVSIDVMSQTVAQLLAETPDDEKGTVLMAYADEHARTMDTIRESAEARKLTLV